MIRDHLSTGGIERCLEANRGNICPTASGTADIELSELANNSEGEPDAAAPADVTPEQEEVDAA